MSRGSSMSSRAGGSRAGAAGRMLLARRPPGFLATLGMTLLVALALSGCRQKMATQPRYDPLEPSAFWEDGMSARPRIAGTVARGELDGDPYLTTGKIDGVAGDGFPFEVTRAVVDRGQQRYEIYCAQCHSRTGDGNGMIPSRGFRRPPSFHTETLRTAPTGHFFDVITNGFGSMPPYATMITPRDRWAIVAYVRALQISQHAAAAELPAAERMKLDGPAQTPVTATGGHH